MYSSTNKCKHIVVVIILLHCIPLFISSVVVTAGDPPKSFKELPKEIARFIYKKISTSFSRAKSHVHMPVKCHKSKLFLRSFFCDLRSFKFHLYFKVGQIIILN